MLKCLFFIIRLCCQYNPISSVLPSPDISITCRNKQYLILFIRDIQHIQHPNTRWQNKIFLSYRNLPCFLFFHRRNIYHQLFRSYLQALIGWLTCLRRNESNHIRRFLIIGNLIDIRQILHFSNQRIHPQLRRPFSFDIMLDLIIFALEILQHSRLFDYIIGKFLPFHISIPIDIYFPKERCEISHQSCLAVRQVDLPELEMTTCDSDKLWEGEIIPFLCKLFTQKVDG